MKSRSKVGKYIWILFAVLVVWFLLWNVHRSGMLRAESEDIIARADYLIEQSQQSIERWNHGSR